MITRPIFLFAMLVMLGPILFADETHTEESTGGATSGVAVQAKSVIAGLGENVCKEIRIVSCSPHLAESFLTSTLVMGRHLILETEP